MGEINTTKDNGKEEESQDVVMRKESGVSQDNEMSQATDNSKSSGPRKRNRKRKPTGAKDNGAVEESKDQKPRPQTAQPQRNNNNQQKQGQQQQQSAADKQYQVKGAPHKGQ